MKICSKCGNLMMPQKDEKKTSLVCRKCGRKAGPESIDPSSGRSARIRERIEHNLADTIPVVGEKSIKVLPITKIDCPECGNREAQWWTQQTRASDEPETRFYRCTSCKKTWREYS